MFCCLSGVPQTEHALLHPSTHLDSKQQGKSAGGRSNTHGPPISLSALPHGAIASVLRQLPFRERCMTASVCRSWAAIVCSAAAESDEPELPVDWALTRALPCEVEATQHNLQYQLQQCRALQFATSARVWMCAAGSAMLGKLQGLTWLQLLDARCDAEGRQLSATAAEQAAVSLQHLTRLRGLNLGIASAPIVDFAMLPSSLQCLHLNLASGYSVGQLHTTCTTLAAAGPCLPQLRHISLGMELDALLLNSKGAVLAPLSGLTQLTSLALVEYQYLPPDAPTHEGYAIVPPVLKQLHGLRQVDLRLCSGQHAQLGPAAHVPDVRLVLTLARHEQMQFNRLPPSLVQLTGLTSLSILMAEFAYEPDTDLYVFDAAPLALCPRLSSLLLELHGAKCSQHDLRGLAQLQGLHDLVVLFKCPDVHDARPGLESFDSAADAAAVSNGAVAAAAPGSAGSADSGSSSGLSGWLSRTSSALCRPGSRGIASMLCKALSGSSFSQVQQQQQQQQLQGDQEAAAAAAVEESRLISVVCEEWVLQLLDTALDQLRPEFALSVPRVSGRLLLATTSRLLLRQPHMVAAAEQPMLLASHLQPDCESVGDMWGGESFLTRRSPAALKAWVNRNWQPRGVELLAAARYPKLSAYPGCRQRINDSLLVVARKGCSGRAVVQALMDTVEERCMSYFT